MYAVRLYSKLSYFNTHIIYVSAVEKKVRRIKVVEVTQRFKRIYKIDKVQQFLIYKIT